MSYNVHSCVGTDGVRSPARIAEVIAAAHPDVVALQELDHRRPRSQGVHQARVIAEELAMHFHFHPALRVEEEEYGDAILSRQPLALVRAAGLPVVRRGWFVETRGALWVEAAAEGAAWQIINTHFGLGRAERLAQACALLGPEWIGAASARPPLVVCGDLNSQAGGRVQRLFAAQLRDTQPGRHRATFPSRFPMLCLDYIFAGEGVRVRTVEVQSTPLARLASDHLPLVADLEFKGTPTAAAPAAGAPPRAADA